MWRDLVKEMFDSVEPFMSEENIGAGERGLPKIAAELAGTNFGIIVVTQENQNSPWLNFEAGALSKDIEDGTVRVAPSLVDFERKIDVTGPLGQFQASLLTQEGVEFILVEIAKMAGIDASTIKKRLGHAWQDEYAARFAKASTINGTPSTTEPRDQGELLDEILSGVRELLRNSSPDQRSLRVLRGATAVGSTPLVLVGNDKTAAIRNRVAEEVRHELLPHAPEVSIKLEGGPETYGAVVVIADTEEPTDSELQTIADRVLAIPEIGSCRFVFGRGTVQEVR